MMDCKKCHRAIPDGGRFCPFCGTDQQKKRKARRSNGEGSVTKCGGNRAKPYRAAVMIDLKRYNVGYFKTEAEARKAIALFDESRKPPETVTLGKVYETVIKTKETEIASTSMSNYTSIWTHMRHLADRNTCDLRAADFQQIIDQMKRDGRKGKYCEKVRVLVGLLWGWLISNEYATVNISKHLKIPTDPKPTGKQTFSTEDLNKLWNDGTPEANFVLIMCYTGMRIGELLPLEPANVHLDEDGHSYLIGGEKTEAGRNRIIAIHPRLIPIFRAWLSSGNRYLLRAVRSDEPMPYVTFKVKLYAPLLKRLGIEWITPHKSRHTFATMVANAGGNQVSMQRQLGHSNFQTTANYYVHTDIENLEELVKLIK